MFSLIDTYELKAENFIMLDNHVETPIYRGMVETINAVYTWNSTDSYREYKDIKGDTIGSKALFMTKGRSFKIVYGLAMTFGGSNATSHQLYFNFDGDIHAPSFYSASTFTSGYLIYTLNFYVSEATSTEATVQYTMHALNAAEGFNYMIYGELILPLVDNVTHIQNVFYQWSGLSQPLNVKRIKYIVERIA